MKQKMMFLLASAITLSACSGAGPMREDYTYSTEANLKAQAVEPYAAYKEYKQVTMDGQKAEKVINRYRGESSKADSSVLVK